jgi:hypothetical protein
MRCGKINETMILATFQEKLDSLGGPPRELQERREVLELRIACTEAVGRIEGLRTKYRSACTKSTPYVCNNW